ncbi:MAG: hypothetical protein QM762_18165 [Chryseolinea sp.]
MATYYFKTEEFGISDEGFHLLRSGFNYKTIMFSEITRIRIERGKELHNWWLVLILGLGLLALGVYMSLGAIRILLRENLSPRHAKLSLLLLIPVVGGYFVYNSFQTGLVIKIDCADGEKDMFPLRNIIKGQKLNELIAFLSASFGGRLHIFK